MKLLTEVEMEAKGGWNGTFDFLLFMILMALDELVLKTDL